MKKLAKKSKAKVAKARKTDKRQNPSAKKAHQATKAKPKKKRGPRVAAPPPREVGLLDAIGEVLSEVESLGEEMRAWADNMPESKQGGDKHSEVETCADTLEEAANADPVDSETMAFLNDVKIMIQDPTPRRRGFSRSARLGHAVDILGDVIMALEEFESKEKGQPEIAEELRGSLDEIESNLQGVDFPGMFG